MNARKTGDLPADVENTRRRLAQWRQRHQAKGLLRRFRQPAARSEFCRGLAEDDWSDIQDNRLQLHVQALCRRAIKARTSNAKSLGTAIMVISAASLAASISANYSSSLWSSKWESTSRTRSSSQPGGNFC
jgi:hypothetical protein